MAASNTCARGLAHAGRELGTDRVKLQRSRRILFVKIASRPFSRRFVSKVNLNEDVALKTGFHPISQLFLCCSLFWRVQACRSARRGRAPGPFPDGQKNKPFVRLHSAGLQLFCKRRGSPRCLLRIFASTLALGAGVQLRQNSNQYAVW